MYSYSTPERWTYSWKCLELVLLPAMEVVILVEQDDGTGLQARTERIKDRDRGRIQIAIDMQKRHRSRVFFEKAGQGSVKIADHEFNVVGHLGQFLLRECPDRITVPVFLDAIERVESVYGAFDQWSDPAHGFATANPEFEAQAVLRYFAECVLHKRIVLLEIRGIDHVGFDVLKRLLLRLQVHIDQQV